MITRLEWKPNERCRFFLIEKKTGKVIKTEYVSAEAFFFLHIVNCYEQNNQVGLKETRHNKGYHIE